MEFLSTLLDKASNLIAKRKGLLPIIGILLILFNFILVLFAPGWFSDTNFFLHLGMVTAILGFMLSWAL